MRVDVYLALVTALASSVLLPPATRRLAPRPAAFTLVFGGLLAAGVWAGAVALLAASVIGRIGFVGYLGHWSTAVFAANEPVPPFVGLIGVGMLIAASGATLVALRKLIDEAARLYRLHRETAPARCGDIAVIDAPTPEAVALPGWRGSIVLTSAMLRALTPAEQRVLLAHERSHVRNRHWLFRLAVRLAAALLPTLRPTVRQCDQALERWADESAADAVRDRRLAATAVAKAALAGAALRRSPLAAGIADGAVAARVEALLAERSVSRWAVLALPTAVLTAATVTVLSAGADLEDLFELARHL